MKKTHYFNRVKVYNSNLSSEIIIFHNFFSANFHNGFFRIQNEAPKHFKNLRKSKRDI